MTWIIWIAIAFGILCGACAAAFIWAGSDDERNEHSGAIEGDQRNFGQRSPSC
jgi:hypothetical protein